MDIQTTLVQTINKRITELSNRKFTVDMKLESYTIPSFSTKKDAEQYSLQLEEEINHNKELLRILHS